MDKAKLLGQLQTGEVTVKFVKKNGDDRIMRCTLCPALMPKYEPSTKEHKKPVDTVVAVWDLDKEAWRSFDIDRIKEVL